LGLAHFRRHDLRELHDHHLTGALAVPAVATVAVACARKGIILGRLSHY
jgi:hypothetical protein